MFLHKCYRIGRICLGSRFLHKVSTMKSTENVMSSLSKYLNINKSQAEYLYLKHPAIRRLNGSDIEALIDTLYDIGMAKEVLIKEPLIFSILPVTLRYRFQVLQECGIHNISYSHIVSYFPLVRQKTIEELKRSGEIPSTLNVENRLAGYITQWPTSLTTLILQDINNCTLYLIRLKIIQRYLELVLDVNNDEFYRGIETYPTIKHRPLSVINETLKILQSQVMMPTQKIKSNLYLIQADPNNLKHIIYNIGSIGGIDVKEILRMYPKIALKNYKTLIEIGQVLHEFGISNEAQRRCFEIYTLGLTTVRERLEKAKDIPEFETFFNHPRFLKMIYYNNTALNRLMKLYSNNKKCLSLNVLSGSSAHYDTFEKAPGDRLGKGKDLVFCVSQFLGKPYTTNDVRRQIKKHPFWINIPLVQVKYVFQKLSTEFSKFDIYKNCPILLYPWSKIKEVMQILKSEQRENSFSPLPEQLNLDKLNLSQKLSLVLYLLEKDHYFTGNGVWAEEKSRNIVTPKEEKVKR